MGMYQDQVSSRGMATAAPSRFQECDPRTLTERMSNVEQTAKAALDRLGEIQARITGLQHNLGMSGPMPQECAPPRLIPHSLESVELTLSAMHDRLAEIERVL